MENLEQKFAELLKNNNEAFDAKQAELTARIEKGASKEELNVLKEELLTLHKENQTISTEWKEKAQEQLDSLSTQVKKMEVSSVKESKADPITSLIKENFEAISKVKDGNPFSLAVKDMTLGSNLVGDQPRDYNEDVVRRRPQGFVNVRDLARTFPISGGTYTYTRSALTSGSVGKQTEGALKNELVYTYTMVDANTDFLAGFAVYSRKMRNNLPWMEATLSMDLRDDYTRGENAEGQSVLSNQATASTQSIAGKNKIEMLIAELGVLASAGSNAMATDIVITPADYYEILVTEKSTGAGYGLPGIVTFENGIMRINGVLVRMANWLPANKYYVGNFERFSQPITEGFTFSVSEDDSDNFRKNNLTAKVEQQLAFAVERPSDIIYGDFTAT